jgi:hypothetical protein
MNALSPSQPDRPSYGLRSLGDMLELNAAPFYQAIRGIEHLRGSIDIEKWHDHQKSTGPLYRK